MPLRLAGVHRGRVRVVCQAWAIRCALGQWMTVTSEWALNVGYSKSWGWRTAGMKSSNTAISSAAIAVQSIHCRGISVNSHVLRFTVYEAVSASAADDEEEAAQYQEHSHDPFQPHRLVKNKAPDDELKNIGETDQWEGQ